MTETRSGQQSGATSPDRRRFNHGLFWAIVGSLAGVGSLVTGALALLPSSSDSSRTTPSTTASAQATPSPLAPSSPVTAPPTASPSASPSPPSNRRYLADLEPVAGKVNLTSTPTPRAVRIGCATGQLSDPFREVAYPLYGAYRRLSMQVVALGSAPRETRVQVKVLVDQQQRANAVLRIGQDAPQSADLSGSTLTLRVVCESSAGVVELRDAYLE